MKVLILMFMAVLLTNPLSNQLLVILFEQFIFLISPAAPYTMGVFAASVVFYMGMKYTEMSKVKLPKKSKKTSKDGMKFELSK